MVIRLSMQHRLAWIDYIMNMNFKNELASVHYYCNTYSECLAEVMQSNAVPTFSSLSSIKVATPPRALIVN